MFGKTNSPSGESKRTGSLRLEALEDRTTPAVTGINVAQGQFSIVDRMFAADTARFSLLEVALGGAAANRASSPQVQALGQQIVALNNTAFVQDLPLLVQAGLGLQFTSTDAFLINSLPSLTGSGADTQILAASAVIQFQEIALFQAEATFGSNATVRGFAQGGLPFLQAELQSTVGLLGQNGTNFAIGTFSQIGQFGTAGVLGTSGLLGTVGTNATLTSAGVTTPLTTTGVFGTSFLNGFNFITGVTNANTGFGSFAAPTSFGVITTAGTFGATTQFDNTASFSGGGTPGTFGTTGNFGFSNFGGGTLGADSPGFSTSTGGTLGTFGTGPGFGT